MFHLNVLLTVREPANADKVEQALCRMARICRAEQGCERWEAYRFEDADQFLLVEHWTTKEDWERHREGVAIQQIYLPEVIPLVERQGHPSKLLD